MTETAASRDVALYDRHAEAWDRLRSRKLAESAWLDRFTENLRTEASILDIGCGAGEPIAAGLASRGYRITGVDSSPAMIAKARERMPAQSWLVADMRRLMLGQRFDGLLAWDSFFHLTRDDQRAMFPIFAAHAATECSLMFTSGPADGEAVGSFEGEPLYHASLAPEEYRSLLGAAGFSVVGHAAEDPTCGGHTVWLARHGNGRVI
ncbi:MAG: class I SAM-dependent methyltransferase [Hyphomicrobiaceae bacterium]